MTTAADDFADEEAFEAFLAGRPVADAGAGLATFAAAVRATATQPGRPNAALAELLATGLLVDQSVPSPRTASIRRRRRLTMFLPALIAKIVSAGAIAQAATGAGVAVVVVCSAGAAGVLPGPVQETFSSIVGADTPEDTNVTTTVDDATATPPAPTESADPTTQADPTETEPAETTEAAPTGEADSTQVVGPAPGESFGQWIKNHGGVHHGEVAGKPVSEWAHQRNADRRNSGSDDGSTDGSEDGSSDAGSTEAPSGQGSDGSGHGGHGND